MAVDPRRAAERRAWIAAHHPDRGGDPTTFAAGLAQFELPARATESPGLGRVSVTASRSPVRRFRRWLRRRGRPGGRRLG